MCPPFPTIQEKKCKCDASPLTRKGRQTFYKRTRGFIQKIHGAGVQPLYVKWEGINFAQGKNN